MTIEEANALYEREPITWQKEADRMGNCWMYWQRVVSALTALEETSPSRIRS